jgi:hypothetical protein
MVPFDPLGIWLWPPLSLYHQKLPSFKATRIRSSVSVDSPTRPVASLKGHFYVYKHDKGINKADTLTGREDPEP